MLQVTTELPLGKQVDMYYKSKANLCMFQVQEVSYREALAKKLILGR